MQPPLPFDVIGDACRLAVLASYGGPEGAVPRGLEDVVHLASRLCGTQVALVSLVGAQHQQVKARVGLDVCTIPITDTACAYTLAEPEILVIPDLRADARSAHFSFVSEAPHLRFYAGARLLAEGGEALGTICVLDARPRPQGLSAVERADLMALARLVMTHLDQLRADGELRRVLAERDALILEVGEEARRQSALLALGDAQRETSDVATIARVAARTLCETLGLSRAGYGIASPDRTAMEIVADWHAATTQSFTGTYRMADFGDIGALMERGEVILVDDVVQDPRTAEVAQAYLALGIRTMVIVPILTAGRLTAAFCLHDLEPRVWSLPMLRFVKNVTDRTAASVTRARAEEEQSLLNREIGHRMKNMLAMVQAIATQTLRGASDAGEAAATLSGRISALSSAHDLLLGGHAVAGDLAGLVQAALGGHVGAFSPRLTIEGPCVEVPSQIAMSLSLILHELGTNATKYGAWSTAGGSVAVSWTATEGRLDILWCERGGPPVVAPLRRGFGSRLIDRGLFGSGTVSLDFVPTGVVCRIGVAW